MGKPLVVAFSGGCVSGKTTTMMNVKKALEFRELKVLVIGENIRNRRIESIDELRKDPKRYLHTQESIIRQKVLQEANALTHDCDVVLVDRALSDSLFYLTFYVDKANFKYEDWHQYEELHSFVHEKAVEHFNIVYDLVYEFKPLRNAEVQDVFRPKSINILRKTESRLINAFNNAYCPPLKHKLYSLNTKPQLVESLIIEEIWGRM